MRVHTVEEVVEVVRTIFEGMEVINNDKHFAGVDFLFVQVCNWKDLFFVFFEVFVDIAFVLCLDLPATHNVDATPEVSSLQQRGGQLLNKSTLPTSFTTIQVNICWVIPLHIAKQFVENGKQ